MNKLETKDKLFKFCEGLNKEGLLSNEELKKCYSAFDKTTSINSPSGELSNLNNNLLNYGMSEDQALQKDKLLLGSNKTLTCRFTINKNQRNKDGASKKVKMTLYSTIESDTTAKLLYLKNLNGSDNSSSDNYNDKIVSNITFKLTKNDSGNYTIKNYYTNEYLKVEMDKTVKLNGTNQTDNALFNLKMVGKYVKLESVAFPGFYLNGNSPLNVVDGSVYTQNWLLEIIDDNTNVDNGKNTDYIAEHTRQLINEYLKNYESNRLNYLMDSAKIKYIEILKKRIKTIVNRNGVLINYLKDRVSNGELDIPKEQLMLMEASIYEEVEYNEIELLDQMKMDIERKSNISKSNTNNTQEFLMKINTSLDDAIAQKRTELATLNDLMDRVNYETKELNSKDSELQKILHKKEDIHERSTINHNLVEKQYAQATLNYRLFIGMYVVLIASIMFLSFKLLQKSKQYF